jgi:hypothetical protein
MNSYSLAADSRRWWWLPATAGAVGTAAVTVILVVPVTGTATPVDLPAPAIGGAVVRGQVTVVERPCYLARPDWNTVSGWEHPVCTTSLRGRVTSEDRSLNRVAPGYLP